MSTSTNEPSSAAARGQVTKSAADVYHEFFVPALFGQWPDRVLDQLDVATGDQILDVGCGTGILAQAAARRSGDPETITGVDVNPGMLDVARRGPTSIAWVEGTAENLPFDDNTFDAVASQFALMFFTNRVAAVREMARVLRPGGSLAVATWAELDTSPGYAAMVDLLDRLIGPEAGNALRAPFVIGTAEELRSTLGSAFAQIEVTQHPGVARFASIDAWVHTDVRGWTLADMIDDQQFEHLLQSARTELNEFVQPDGSVLFPAPALIGVARAT